MNDVTLNEYVTNSRTGMLEKRVQRVTSPKPIWLWVYQHCMLVEGNGVTMSPGLVNVTHLELNL